ncbi:PIR Superfamily Protein [Plasmodium ovale curtisi]|uniref:PIR Superfamily Protein n=1 Tax=Plasmodium ovale curtisi TaxID=864141 RepID=A0A1A8VK28_PLAOA|nr:PIR Superfamily Protein [Plasmodium ovale curtisi]
MSLSHKYENYLSHKEYNDYKNKLTNFRTHYNSVTDNSCFSVVNEGIKEYSDISKHFKKLQQYLDHYRTNTNGCKSNKCCIYINYWLNDQLRNKNNSLNISHFDFYKKYMACYQRKNSNICESYIYLMQEGFKFKKELYDLYDAYYDYSPFKNKQDLSHIYANVFIKKHNDIVNKCKYKENYDMCSELQGVRESFEKDKVETLKVFHGDLLELLQIPDPYPSEKVKASELSHHTFPIQFLPGIIGIVILLLFSYKFTPFGSLIRTLMNSNNNILNNLEEKTQKFLNNSKRGNINYEKRQYNIAYNTVDSS